MIDYFSMNRLSSPLIKLRSNMALKARKRMFDLFYQEMQLTDTSKVLDLGVTPDQSLPESNFFERFYPYKQNVTAASIEKADFLEKLYPGMKFVEIKDKQLPFADNEFEVVFCSAVIEHVGNHAAQQAFIQETLRVAKKFFFTTPNRQFPLDFHTMLPLIHWLPQPTHQKILTKLGHDFWAKTENLNLLSPNRLMRLFPTCQSIKLYKYRLLGLPSNLVIYGTK